MNAPRFTRTAFLIWGGLLTWAGYFLFVYAFAALACARAFFHVTVAGLGIVTVATLAGLVVAAAITLAILRRARQRITAEVSPIARFLASALSVLALLCILWIALPVLILRTSC